MMVTFNNLLLDENSFKTIFLQKSDEYFIKLKIKLESIDMINTLIHSIY